LIIKEHFGQTIADTDIPPYLRVKEWSKDLNT
jgi:hypothetical protein